MAMTLAPGGALVALALVAVASAIDNGIGLTPPRGWRSWNAFNCLENKTIITQAHMLDQMAAVVDKSRTVDGKPTSLAELGFNWISMDDGWQQCNCSTRQDVDPTLPTCPNLCFGGFCTWHDKAGSPIIRKDRFPDMKSLVDHGHSLGLNVGTYLNNCICMEAGSSTTHYEEDVRWMMGLGFDGVKVDSCGSSKNVSHWADLFNATGKPVRIENCHNGWPDFKTGFCPMNFFRTGGDISPDIGDILGQAYGTVDASDLPEPRSRPGCWGYPDMSEVGNFAEGPSQADQERTHWGLWCIVSSPLILGFDMKDSAKMDRVWPIITNTDALSVSEAWAGHPGTLVKVYPAVGHSFQLVQGPCDGSPRTLGWRFDGGNLFAPKTEAMLEAQCVHSPAAGACPPPTTRSKDVQCGLLLSNCSSDWKGRWDYAGSQIRWSDGNPKDKPQCLGAFPISFDVTQGYFTRQAATVRMDGCQGLAEMPRNTSCAAPRAGVDVSGPQVIAPKDPSQVCNVDSAACCAACDREADCKAFVWKAKESHGVGCKSDSSYCWLLSGFAGTHAAADGTFGTKGPMPPAPPSPAPPPPPAPPAPPAPPSPGTFDLTGKGELRTAQGACLVAAPVSGVELWSKPLSKSRIAILLVNPTDRPQPLLFPLKDVPDFEGVSLGCSTAGRCSVRDVWAHKDVPDIRDKIKMELPAFGSAFYILSMRDADVVLLSI